MNSINPYPEKIIRKAIRVYGSVQGVGFRFRTKYAADNYGVTGWVKNEPDGSVSMELQGTEEQIDMVFISINQGTYISIERMDVKSLPVIENEYSFSYD